MIGDVMIKRLGLIGQLADEDKEALLSIAGEERDLQPGEDILTDGQRPTFSVIVLADCCNVTRSVPVAADKSIPSTCPTTRRPSKPST